MRSLVHFEYNVAHKEKVHSIVFTGLYHHSLLHSKIIRQDSVLRLLDVMREASVEHELGHLGYFHRE